MHTLCARDDLAHAGASFCLRTACRNDVKPFHGNRLSIYAPGTKTVTVYSSQMVAARRADIG